MGHTDTCTSVSIYYRVTQCLIYISTYFRTTCSRGCSSLFSVAMLSGCILLKRVDRKNLDKKNRISFCICSYFLLSGRVLNTELVLLYACDEHAVDASTIRHASEPLLPARAVHHWQLSAKNVIGGRKRCISEPSFKHHRFLILYTEQSMCATVRAVGGWRSVLIVTFSGFVRVALRVHAFTRRAITANGTPNLSFADTPGRVSSIAPPTAAPTPIVESRNR